GPGRGARRQSEFEAVTTPIRGWLEITPFRVRLTEYITVPKDTPQLLPCRIYNLGYFSPKTHPNYLHIYKHTMTTTTTTTTTTATATTTATTATPNLVILHTRHLRLRFPNPSATHADFHYFWLRHNCPCLSGCRHPLSKERVIDSIDFSMHIQPLEASVVDDELHIVWDDAEHHVTVYPLEWLRENAYALARSEVVPPGSDNTKVVLEYAEFLEKWGDGKGGLSEEGLRRYRLDCGLRLKVYGLVVIKGRGQDTEGIIREFITEKHEVISTHFGRIEDLRTDNTTNKNTDQLGYTNATVDLHTDQPYIENPPGFQFLQCVRQADVGGDSYLCDAFQAARYIRSEISSRVYDLLTTVPVRFDRRQAAFQSLVVRPLIEPVAAGSSDLKQVRFSYFTHAPHDEPFERMQEWYEAYNTFAGLVRDPKFQYRFRLQPGDLVLYDNFRMLHARTAFKGSRHMRGVYFDTSDVWETLLGQ
ncbi:hypothetical protein BC936DRAFT_146184, partial [Jimgerdemannia flammicorona]